MGSINVPIRIPYPKDFKKFNVAVPLPTGIGVFKKDLRIRLR